MTGIRAVRAADVPALKSVIDATGLFPSEMLDGMLRAYLAGEDTDALWLTDDAAGPVAVAYCAPERMTSGTWNLLLIAVHPARQNEGRGAALIGHVETAIRARGAHLLLVETSGMSGFARVRDYYPRRGFVEAARIGDFYQPGEDKIVFRKVLATGNGRATS